MRFVSLNCCAAVGSVSLAIQDWMEICKTGIQDYVINRKEIVRSSEVNLTYNG